MLSRTKFLELKSSMQESIEQALSVGDIMRTEWPEPSPTHLNLLLGNGTMGGCFDRWGLMNEPFRSGEMMRGNNPTVLSSARHWFRDSMAFDCFLPILSLGWSSSAPSIPKDYHQHLRLFDGTLTTKCRGADYALEVVTALSPAFGDLLVFKIQHRGPAPLPGLKLSPVLEFSAGQQQLHGSLISVLTGERRWVGRLEMGGTTTQIEVEIEVTEGDIVLRPESDNLQIDCLGTNVDFRILISIGGAIPDMSDRSSPDLLEQFAIGWKTRWGDSYVCLPLREHQALWARSMFYMLAAYGVGRRSPAPPMGWAGEGWWQHFPQDVSFILPALLRYGHTDIARTWIEFYHDWIPEMRRYTRRLFQADGVMWAWQFPIGPCSELGPESGGPAPYRFQIHNSAYPARMAYDTARAIGDSSWSLNIAWPIVYESARFYGSILRQQPDGTWGIHLVPSFGQEEFGGSDAPNYLCSLFAARYTLTTALEMVRSLGITVEEELHWKSILSAGFAFPSLLDPLLGIYSTNGATTATEISGKQKHPIQLSPLALLPQGEPDQPTLMAFHLRADLCQGFHEGKIWGWTMVLHWLAAVHLGRGDEFIREFDLAVCHKLIDREWIQIYESTSWGMFYVTSHGLFLQAVGDAFVHSFFGDLRIEKGVPSVWARATYHNLRGPDGTKYSGSIAG